MNKTYAARQVLASYPDTRQGRYQAATELMGTFGITRNHARVLVNRARSAPKQRGGARGGAGKFPHEAPAQDV